MFLDKGLTSTVNLFGREIDLKWFYGVLVLLLFVGFTNAVNFSDGLDGLAAGLLIIAFSATALIARFAGNTEVTLFALAVTGAVLAFFVITLTRRRSSWVMSVLWPWGRRLLICLFL